MSDKIRHVHPGLLGHQTTGGTTPSTFTHSRTSAARSSTRTETRWNDAMSNLLNICQFNISALVDSHKSWVGHRWIDKYFFDKFPDWRALCVSDGVPGLDSVLAASLPGPRPLSGAQWRRTVSPGLLRLRPQRGWAQEKNKRKIESFFCSKHMMNKNED